ncbi:uncharacterized protein LOC125942394 [Dermacentor silvarum]|uniref:uncharacterized protein LOC125942394 n=1 Tax=Dermacentor silvarum TaxID=543639 RepID=UPI002100EC97|nr:uncharacterized protein LOC125942394 [Dermacentor silvarum]
MPAVSKEDQGATPAGFAEILANADAGVFGSADNVLAIFKAADEEFCNVGTTCLSATCTFSEIDSCWAVGCQRGWNELFNRRGVEVIQLQKRTLYFRTSDVNPEDLEANGDVKFLCLYLWLLRQHRCISGVILSIPVLAPRHESLFMSLLKLTDYVEKCEMHGNYPFIGRSLAKSDSRVILLDNLCRLRELGLATVHLLDDDVAILARLVEQNPLLVALVIIDVDMSALALAELIERVVEHKKLEDFRIKMRAKEPQTVFNDALSFIGQSRTISRLYVHVDHGLLSLLRGLLESSSLRELTLEPMIDDAKVLCALADLLEKQASCIRLKACFQARHLSLIPDALDNLERMVSKSSLSVLVLSGSVFTHLPACQLANALAESKTLRKLFLQDCQLTCADVQPFVVAIRRSSQFEELNVGAVTGRENEQCELLNNMAEFAVCDKITLTYKDCLVASLQKALQTSLKFVNISLSYGENTEAEPILRAMRGTVKTLKSLCIDTPRVLSSLGGQFLANLIRNGDSLKVVRLRCRTKASASIQILKALAESSSVVVLTIERWDLSENVQRIFVDMLRQNRSLNRLEFYWNNVSEYESFKKCLINGLQFNHSIIAVKMHQGPQRDELAVRDFELLQYLHRNEMILAWIADVILRDGRCPEGAAVVDLLNSCEAPLDLFQPTSDSLQRAANTRFARMATRTHFYALLTAFRGRPDFELTAGKRALFEDLHDSIIDEVSSSLGLEKPTSTGSSTSDGQ